MRTYSYNVNTTSRLLCPSNSQEPITSRDALPIFIFGEDMKIAFSFPNGTLEEGETLMIGVDTDMFSGGDYASMINEQHIVTAEEAANSTVEMTLHCNFASFLDKVNGIHGLIDCFFAGYIVHQDGSQDCLFDQYYIKAYARGVVVLPDDPRIVLPNTIYYNREQIDQIVNTMNTQATAAEQAKGNAIIAKEAAELAAEGAANSATEAESYAHGGTGTREGEDDDNAMKYNQQAGEAKADAETARDDAIKITEGTPQQVQPYGLQKSAKGHANDAKENAIKTAFDRSQVEALIATISQATLGPCTNIGVVHSANAKQISWTDPADLYIGTSQSPFVKWEKTELWRREGNVWPEYPGAPGCVKVAETAMGGEHVRDEYSTTAFVDSGLTEGQTYAYALFSYSTAGAVTVSPANQIPVSDVWTWPLVHYFSQAGTLLNYMPIGSVMTFTHADFDNTKLDGVQLDGIAARLMDYDGVRAWDAALFPHCAVWQTIDCLYSASHSWGTSAFDAAEQQYALTEDTVAVAGKVYYTNDGTTYTALVEGTDWDAGDPIPAASWFEKNPNPNYSSGLNRDTQSNAFQYFNLDAPAGNMVKRNLWESGLTYNGRPGFLYHLEQALKNVLVPVRRTVALRTIYGHDETYKAKIFLPSRYEVFGTVNNGVAEGVRRWKWYGDRAADASSRVKLLNGSATVWWLSSPNTGNYNEYTVSTSGAEHNGYPTSAYGLAPAYVV